MAKKFRFKEVKSKSTKEASNEEPALEWTPEQLEAMSQTTDEDLDEVKDWLKRTGQDEAAAMFDAA